MGMGFSFSSQSNDVFDYRFSGISVWLEPGDNDDGCATNPYEQDNHPSASARFKTKMGDLAEKCGGPPQGLHPFEPHCTLLYNIPKASILAHSTLDESDHSEIDRLKDASNKLLHRCVEEYSHSHSHSHSNAGSKRLVANDSSNILLKPTSAYAVVYPTFRCSISFLFLELTREMESLHKITTKVFPPDERHQQGGTLQPHISLIYAPINSFNLLQTETDRLPKAEPSLFEPVRAKYLSVWSTEGTTSDWKLIARVEIP